MAALPLKRCVAIYGGSFNPPHIAHVLMALAVLETQEVDELWVVPTFSHALGKELIDYEHRVAMCELAFSALGERVRVDRIESALGGSSRTLDTLQALSAANPDTGFRLIIGADILAETHLWHRWDQVVALAPPIVTAREGFPLGEFEGQALPAITSVSSTELRKRLALGEQPLGELSNTVLQYIARHGLYR